MKMYLLLQYILFLKYMFCFIVILRLESLCLANFNQLYVFKVEN